MIGTPDEHWGEVVHRGRASRARAVEAEELLEHCREQLAGYKRPRAVRFVDALPRNPSGKILKRELRAHEPRRASPRATRCCTPTSPRS